MLITNFAAGELSETLFGRIDIPQYFNGAAKLENFDVIPTGGIKRRGGMERLTGLEGKGRIIPFVVNRSEGFLLYLTPDRISIYKLIDGQIAGVPTIYNNGTNLKLYKTDEICDVQYAQNFNTMILVHENCPPLEVVLQNGFLLINTLLIKFNVSIIVSGGNITGQDKAAYEKDDEQYKTKGRLTTEGNYPSAVSFFQGRLVFAGTKNDRQWIFVSAIKQPPENYNFSTYKIFLTEKKEYSTLFGKIETDDTSLISYDPMSIVNSFGKPPEQYYIESQLYPPGTKIEYINLNKIKLTNPMKTPGIIWDIEGIRAELQAKIDAYNANDNINNGNGVKYTFYTREWCVRYLRTTDHGTSTYYYNVYYSEVSCYIKASSIKVFYQVKTKIYMLGSDRNPDNVEWDTNEPEEWLKYLEADAARIIQNNPESLRNEIMGAINNFIQRDRNVSYPPPKPPSFTGFALFTEYLPDTINEYNNKKTEAVNKLFNNVLSTMYYELNTGYGTELFYNYPDQIMASILAKIINSNATYISIYTREIISDSYPTPDCGFTFEIASDMNDAIKWLAVNKGLIVGTETAEWIIPPGVHATNVQATLNSRYGSDRIQGTAIGDATCFFHAGKKSLIEYYIPQEDNNFRVNNMALLSPQMLRESPAREFDFISSPYTKLVITREDGAAVSLLYERSTGTFAWSRIITEGNICSTAVLPGFDGNDDLYLAVKRGESFYLEVLREDCDVFLDSFVKADGCIGYPYTSRVRSMPVLANNKMKPNNIKNIVIRFLDSYMPRLKALPNEKVDVITNKEPFTGVYKVPFPGVWDNDVSFEFIHDKPNRCRILAINAEVN